MDVAPPPTSVPRPNAPASVSERDLGAILLGVGSILAFAAYFALHGRPFWIRMEGFVGGAWLATTIVLASLLTDGRGVTPSPRRVWFGAAAPGSPDAPRRKGARFGWLADVPAGDPNGVATLVVLGLVVGCFAFWLLIEVLIPVVGAALFAWSRRVVRTAANGASGLAGRPLAAFRSAALAASAVAAPVGALVFVVHLVRA